MHAFLVAFETDGGITSQVVYASSENQMMLVLDLLLPAPRNLLGWSYLPLTAPAGSGYKATVRFVKDGGGEDFVAFEHEAPLIDSDDVRGVERAIQEGLGLQVPICVVAYESHAM